MVFSEMASIFSIRSLSEEASSVFWFGAAFVDDVAADFTFFCFLLLGFDGCALCCADVTLVWNLFFLKPFTSSSLGRWAFQKAVKDPGAWYLKARDVKLFESCLKICWEVFLCRDELRREGLKTNNMVGWLTDFVKQRQNGNPSQLALALLLQIKSNMVYSFWKKKTCSWQSNNYQNIDFPKMEAKCFKHFWPPWYCQRK